MTTGTIWRKMVAFAVPVFLGQMFQQLYNTADSVIVGNFSGKGALAAVSSSGNLIFMMTGFFTGLSLGAGVVISRYFGAKNFKAMEAAVHTNIAFGTVCGVLMSVMGIFLAPQMLIVMNTPEDVLPLSVTYFRLYFIGAFFSLMYNTCMGILQAVGDSRTPLYYLIFSSGVNIVFDLIFVGPLNMGVAGAAWATLISQYVSAILVTLRLLLTKQNYKLSFRHFKIDKPILKNIFKVGLPAGLQSSMYSVGNLLIQSSLNTFGSVVMAGWVAAMKVDDFTYAPICSYGMAMNSFVGQNAGAKRMDRVKKGFYTALIMSVVTAVIIIVPVLILRGDVVRIFNKEADVVSVGSDIILHICPFYVIFGMCEVFSGTLKGLSKSLTAFIITFVGILLTRIIWLYTAVLMTHNLTVLFMIYPISWVVTAAIYFIYLAVKKWDGMLDMTAEDRFIEKLRHIGKKKTA